MKNDFIDPYIQTLLGEDAGSKQIFYFLERIARLPDTGERFVDVFIPKNMTKERFHLIMALLTKAYERGIKEGFIT